MQLGSDNELLGQSSTNSDKGSPTSHLKPSQARKGLRALGRAKSSCGKSSIFCPGKRRVMGEEAGRSLDLARAKIS